MPPSDATPLALGPLLLLLSVSFCYLVEAKDGPWGGAKRNAGIDALNEQICGRRESRRWRAGRPPWSSEQQEPSKRISAGWDAARGEFPWAVKLLIEFGPAGYLCGGTIIHHNLVLTAAHCLEAPEEDLEPEPRVTAWAGMLVSSRDKDVQVGYGKLACYPPGFKFPRAKPRRDLVLIKLDRSFEYNEAVRPICIHQSSDSSRFEPKRCVVAGFGITDNTAGKSKYPHRMQAISQELCDGSEPGAHGLEETEICMMTGDRWKHPGSTCQGDSGSALACPDPESGRFYHEGALSHGPKICGHGHPTISVYADTFKLREDLFKMVEQCL